MNHARRPLRWGIVGCGQIACDKVIPALRMSATAEVVAATDTDRARLERAQQLAPDAKSYQEFEELLADEGVEAVYIATPNFLHAQQTVKAAAAGKHVLCEKPMALSASEAETMVDAAERAGVKLMVAYMSLFNPAYLVAKRVVAEGRLGEVVSARGRHSYPISPANISPAAAWRLDPAHGGGSLLDVAVYPIATLREITGRQIVRVQAVGSIRRLRGLTNWDSIAVACLLDDETPAVVEAGFTYSSSLIELEGVTGRLSLSGHISQAVAGRLEVEFWSPDSGRVGERLVHELVPDGLPHFANYLHEVEHFARCVFKGSEPVASGRIALADMRVVDAIRTSIEEQAAVSILA